MIGTTWRRTLWLIFIGITLSTSAFGQGELPRLEQTEFDAPRDERHAAPYQHSGAL